MRNSFIKNHPDLLAEIISADFLYQKAPCGFISFLPDGSILRVNETLLNWLSLSETGIYNLKFGNLLTKGCHLYYQMVVSSLLNLQGFANEINFTFVSDKGNFDTLFNAIAYKDQSGNLLAVNATIQNIAERKKYEAALRQEKRHAEEEKRKFEFLSNTIPHLVWTTSPSGEATFINQRIKDYFKDPDIDLATIFARVAEEDRESLLLTWKDCLSSGRKLEKEVKLLGKPNTPEWFLIQAEPYYSPEGEIEAWFGSATNIHKRKLLQLANYAAMSQNLNEAYQTIDINKESFDKIALNQSHMIRKPLANIMGLVALLKDLPATAESKQLLELLTESAIEMDQLIRMVVKDTL